MDSEISFWHDSPEGYIICSNCHAKWFCHWLAWLGTGKRPSTRCTICNEFSCHWEPAELWSDKSLIDNEE